MLVVVVLLGVLTANLVMQATNPDLFTNFEIVTRVISGSVIHPIVAVACLIYFRRRNSRDLKDRSDNVLGSNETISVAQAAKKTTEPNNPKWVLKLTSVVMFAMLIYPPFQLSLANGVVDNMGYSWLFSPPRHPEYSELTGSVDVTLLIAQWLGALLVGGLAWFALKGESSK